MRLTRLTALVFPFGGPAGPDVGPSPRTIVDAIHARIDATPALRAILAGRHWDLVAPQPGGQPPPVPYLILQDLGLTAEFRTTGDRAIRTFQFQAGYVGRSPSACLAFVEQLRAAINPRMAPLRVPGKTFLNAWVGRPFVAPDPSRGPAGDLRFEAVIPLAVTFAEDP